MSMAKVLLGVAVGVCVLTLAVVQGQQNDRRKPALTALDYAEIEQLYARYNYGSDTGADDGYLYARTFTPDGAVVIMPNRTITGHKNLADFIRRDDKGPTTIHHFTSNLLVEPSPDGATGSIYLLLANIGANGQPSTVTGGGVYHDNLVRTAEGWRFKKRTYFAATN
jgi:hypothetical protein